MKGFKKLTETDYKLIKALHDAGVKPKQIADITGRSSGTIWTVSRSESLADYRLKVKKMAKPRQAQKAVVDPTYVPIEQPKLDEEVAKLLISNAEALAKIQETVTFIANHIPIAPKRKLW